MPSTALIVAAAPQPPGFDRVAELAARAALVVGVDGGAAACLRAGILPSVVVGDLDSLAPADRHRLEAAGSAFEVFPADKDVTDLDLALAFVTTSGIDRVIATGCTSGRLDHTLAALGSLARAAHLQPMLVEAGLQAWVLSSGHAEEVVLDREGSTFSVVALLGEATVSVSGARWPLERARLEPLGSMGISNLVIGGGATITVHAGTVAVLLNCEHHGGGFSSIMRC